MVCILFFIAHICTDKERATKQVHKVMLNLSNGLDAWILSGSLWIINAKDEQIVFHSKNVCAFICFFRNHCFVHYIMSDINEDQY